jgi:hypothetical protein
VADIVSIDRIAPFRCSVCDGRVEPRSAWIWVDVTVAAAALEARQSPPGTSEDRLTAPLARWGVGHEACAPDYTGIYNTYRELVGFLTDLLGSPRLAGTDLRALLSEAAERSGRFMLPS